jgi:hypothetical protein
MQLSSFQLIPGEINSCLSCILLIWKFFYMCIGAIYIDFLQLQTETFLSLATY